MTNILGRVIGGVMIFGSMIWLATIVGANPFVTSNNQINGQTTGDTTGTAKFNADGTPAAPYTPTTKPNPTPIADANSRDATARPAGSTTPINPNANPNAATTPKPAVAPVARPIPAGW